MLQEPSTLIHRSGDGTLVHTPIQQDAGGLFIVRPRWTSVSGRHFYSVQELAAALEDEGLTLMRVRIDPKALPGASPSIEPAEPVSVAGTSTRPEAAIPDTPLISSPYDIAKPLRGELKSAAATGGNERLLGDAFVGADGHSPLDTFKALRKQLYEAATRFYAELQPAPRPALAPIDPASTAESFIERSLEQFNGLIIGESHADIGSKQWLIEQMPTLARKGVKTLYMEHLLTDFHQPALDNFARTSVMPRDLELYLNGLDRGHMTDPLRRYTFLNLVKEANREGVRIQAIDCMASYRLEGMRGLEPTTRQKMMNFYAHTIIEADQAARGPHKWAALMGNSHSNTYEGVAGVSELEDAVGLRVEDVGYGESHGLEPDPGRTFLDDSGKPIGQVKGDVRLQVQTPWKAQTKQEIDQLLSRPGMYTLKQEPGETLLIHRGRDNVIARTPIYFESGRCFIERPAWPTLHEKRFDSIKALLKALDDRGMTLAGWSGAL